MSGLDNGSLYFFNYFKHKIPVARLQISGSKRKIHEFLVELLGKNWYRSFTLEVNLIINE